MPSYDKTLARPLAGGFQAPGGSVTNPDLASRFKGYKRSIASRYRALTNTDIEAYTPPGPLLASPKVDGEMWFLVFEEGEVWLSNPRGRVVYGDVPLLKEARAFASRTTGLTILAGELFAIRKDARPRHDDLAKAMGGEQSAEMNRVGFFAFDILQGGDAQTGSLEAYEDRLAVMRRLLDGGKRVKCIKTEAIEGAAAVREMYDSLVATNKAEGLVLRSAAGRTFKLKPAFTLDAVVIGYTERIDEPGVLRSMALALIREDGRYQIIGSCGNMDLGTRRRMFEQIAPLACESSFRHASNSGALYRFVKPELVIEIKVTDVLADEPSGDPILRMVAEFDADAGWKATRRMPAVSILHPVFLRVRSDKVADAVDARLSQVSERVIVPQIDASAEVVELPKSAVLRRECYTKTTKGKLAVRKLLVWQTHKSALNPLFPEYVVHFTDYSPGRKDPIKHEVRTAPNADAADAIADDMITKNIKKGWVQA